MQPIPYIDLRGQDFSALIEKHPERAERIIDASRGMYGVVTRAASAVALPLGDRISRRWLRQCKNPYLPEMDVAARALQTPGIYALNCSYEWGCTSGVYAQGASPLLTRVLDWPFPELGAQLVVAHQKGTAGDFYNATWPGVSGVFQAVAPGRFAAALNQAPMRRHPTGILLDWLRNRFRMHRSRALPPAHLLRHVFEVAKSYEEAKYLLTHTPICLPVIYTLSGPEDGQGCVIERTEMMAGVREMHNGRVVAANHFTSNLNGMGWGWLPRANSSIARAMSAELLQPKNTDRNFTWYTAPIANPLSRLVMQMDAASGSFALMGVEGTRAVTPIFHRG